MLLAIYEHFPEAYGSYITIQYYNAEPQIKIHDTDILAKVVKGNWAIHLVFPQANNSDLNKLDFAFLGPSKHTRKGILIS